MDYHTWWIISLMIFLTLMGAGAIIGGILLAKLAICYIYGDTEN